MKNEFVKYEQALALKELGFDKDCLGYYVGKDKEVYISNEDIQPPFKPDLDSKIMFRAPLYQQAFRWFREKHNLCGEVYTVNMGAIDWTFLIRDLYSEDVKHNNFEANTGGYIGTFLTYEEAEGACLNKLIEIVMNQLYPNIV